MSKREKEIIGRCTCGAVLLRDGTVREHPCSSADTCAHEWPMSHEEAARVAARAMQKEESQ